MRVNTFFAHFIKEIDTRRYGDNIRILPTNNTINIYRYYDAMLKHMPDDALKTYDETLLYSKTAIKLANNVHRRPNNTDNSRTDDNLDDRIDKFHDLLGKKKIYRIPLRFLIDLGLVNFPISFDTRYILTLERDFKQVDWIEKKVNPIAESDAKIIIFSRTWCKNNNIWHAIYLISRNSNKWKFSSIFQFSPKIKKGPTNRNKNDTLSAVIWN